MSKKKKEKHECTENEPQEEFKVSDLMNESLKKALDEAKEFKDKYYRALAESENSRKRLQQEKEEMISYAIDNMLCEFLTPLDNLENALKYSDNLSEELKNWATGFKMIAAQFNDVLVNHGVVPFTSVGKPFDPHYHDAVELVESEETQEDTVVEEISKGYLHGKRILRPAKVKVSKTSSHADSHNKEESNSNEGE